MLSIGQLYHLQISDIPTIYDKAHERTHGMESILAGSPRVEVEYIELLVVHSFEYVAVPTDEELWRTEH